MGKGRALIAACLVLGVVGMSVGVERALGGPGGGTCYANSPSGGASGTALRKFVDGLPGLGSANQNNLGQYIPDSFPVWHGERRARQHFEAGTRRLPPTRACIFPARIRDFSNRNSWTFNFSSRFSGLHRRGADVMA